MNPSSSSPSSSLLSRSHPCISHTLLARCDKDQVQFSQILHATYVSRGSVEVRKTNMPTSEATRFVEVKVDSKRHLPAVLTPLRASGRSQDRVG